MENVFTFWAPDKEWVVWEPVENVLIFWAPRREWVISDLSEPRSRWPDGGMDGGASQSTCARQQELFSVLKKLTWTTV